MSNARTRLAATVFALGAGVALADEIVAPEAVAQEAVAQEAVAQEAVAQEAVAQEAVAQEAVAQEAIAQPLAAETPTAGVAAVTEFAGASATVTAEDLIAGALDLMRGTNSYAEMSMLIHRPDWQRTSALTSWTRGRDDALIRFTKPARDAGNATLKTGDKMWTYAPKLNRTIRLPYSLMSQSWAGSDFSYNDLSRTDDILKFYDMTITDVTQGEGHLIYTLEGIPHEDSPVVWGKEVWVLRDDYVLISQSFFDQSMELYKSLKTLEIGELGGRVLPIRMRMSKVDEPESYTEIIYEVADFDIELEDRTFTVFALQSGGRR